MGINEQIQYFDSQMYFPLYLAWWICNFFSTMMGYTGLGKNSKTILERLKPWESIVLWVGV